MIATKTALAAAVTNAAWTLANMVPVAVVAAVAPMPEIDLAAYAVGAAGGACRWVVTREHWTRGLAVVGVGAVTAGITSGAHIAGLDILVSGLSDLGHSFFIGAVAVLAFGGGIDTIAAKWRGQK